MCSAAFSGGFSGSLENPRNQLTGTIPATSPGVRIIDIRSHYIDARDIVGVIDTELQVDAGDSDINVANKEHGAILKRGTSSRRDGTIMVTGAPEIKAF